MEKTRTITISVDEETDKKLRHYAINKYGKKKGVIKKVIKEAMDSLIKEDEQARIQKEAIKLLEKGIKTRNSWKFNRAELYER